MAVRKKWLLLMLIGIVLIGILVLRPAFSSKQRMMRLREDVRRREAVCLSLSNAVETAQANVDWNRLQWYYAFRGVGTMPWRVEVPIRWRYA